MLALLLRVDPDEWPIWENKLNEREEVEVWFKPGRRKPDEIVPEKPVVVLGTKGLGIIANGCTTSGVIFRTDPDFEELKGKKKEEYKQEMNLVRVNIKRVNKKVPLADLKKQPIIANLHRTRETTTWLSNEQYEALKDLIDNPKN